ncbi:MAG: TetR/AcrR family transcriptional regulator [Chrysiogenetes bacterium]|nr:TetR/AcrR family transcriptional regulator [Chrysiogenetes bacterium]
MSIPAPARLSPEERRDELLRAAMKVFAEKGYQQTSVADILEGAGVARGTFYRYFDSKKDCFSQALDKFIARIRGPIRELDMSRPLAEPELIELYRRVAGLMVSDPLDREFSRVVLAEASGSEREFRRKLLKFYEEVTEMTAGFLRAAMESGRARKLDPETTARCILGMVKEVVLTWAERSDDRQELLPMVMTVMEFAFYGLLPR